MLVLSRQRDESIIIRENIVVTVVDIRGDKVRIGIEAPVEIPVHRKEVFEAIQRENLQSGQLNKRKLEGNVGETHVSNQPNAYQQFRESLKAGDYLKAYEIFNGNRDLPDRDELCQLICGLRIKLPPYKLPPYA